MRRSALPALVLIAAIAAVPAAAAPRDRGGGTEYLRNVFPVKGPHWTRGSIGTYGAPRSGGRTHEGFDIVASCGAELVAAATGKVAHVGYDPVLYGNYLEIHGQGEDRSYFYAHLIRPPRVRKDERVWAGERVGAVGETGNAITVGCHLHFELHVHGHAVNPEAELRRWDRWS